MMNSDLLYVIYILGKRGVTHHLSDVGILTRVLYAYFLYFWIGIVVTILSWETVGRHIPFQWMKMKERLV